MAWRKLSVQIFTSVSRRQRCTAATAAVPSGCPFHFREKEEQTARSELKSYDSIPTAKGLPIVGTIFDIMKSGGAAKIHEYCDRRHKELGPIFREKLGGVEAVVVANKDFMSAVYSAEGRYPIHLVPEPWLKYNEMKGIKRGLFFMDGPEWLERRKVLNQALLAPAEVAKYTRNFTGVVKDVVKRWGRLTNDNGIVPNLENELYNWSIETLGTILFGQRLECVPTHDTENPSEHMHEFVNYVQRIFTESAKLSLIPSQFTSTIGRPFWKRFVNAADNALRIARYYTEARIAQIQREEVDNPGVLGQLLECENITHDEIVNIVADLILAAADTTSHATQWALYSLAQNPHCQEKLLHEIRQVIGPDEEITYEHLQKIPYADYVVKETLRLYPIAPFLTRILPNRIVLGGYEVPAGKLIIMSQYTMGRDPAHFDDPDIFNPERWQRDQSGEQLKRLVASSPFGSGLRSCIGRRMAGFSMKVLFIMLMQDYHLRTMNKVEIHTRMISTPHRPIELLLRRRP